MHFAEPVCMKQETVDEISRVTWVGVGVNVFLAVIKTAGGLASGSRALLADAFHTISDLATDAAILVGVKFWSAPADADHPHGHHKIETLITLAIGIALAAVGLTMGWEAVVTIAGAVARGDIAPDVTDKRGVDLVAILALGSAVISLIAKELLYRWTAAKGVKLGSSAVVANAWHHRSDAFSSIPPTLTIGANMMANQYGYDLWYLDPIGTIVVCVMLLQAAWEVSAPTLRTLADASADRKLCSGIRKTVLDTPGVDTAHKIRTRTVGPNAVMVDLHIQVRPTLTVVQGHDIATEVRDRLIRLVVPEVESRIIDVMVHVEPSRPTLEEQLKRPASSNTLFDWQPKDEQDQPSKK